MTNTCDRCSGFGWIRLYDYHSPCPKCREFKRREEMDSTICSDGEYAVVMTDIFEMYDRRDDAIVRAKSRTNLDGKKYLVLKVIGYAEQQPSPAVWVDLEDGK